MRKAKKQNSKDAKGFLISALVFSIVSIGFIGGFVLAGDLKERIYRANEDSKDITSESDSIYIASKTTKKTLGFDEKLIDGNGNLDYSINLGVYSGSTDSYFTVNYGDLKKELVITKYSYEDGGSQEYKMSFVGNVVDVYLAQFKNDPNKNALIYLLDNGDICYSYIEDMVKMNEYGSYTAVNELSNIVKFYSGNSCNSITNECETTTYAQSMDGTIYDLSSYII